VHRMRSDGLRLVRVLGRRNGKLQSDGGVTKHWGLSLARRLQSSMRSLLICVALSITLFASMSLARTLRNVTSRERTTAGEPIKIDERCKSYIGSGYFDPYNPDGSQRPIIDSASRTPFSGLHFGIDIVAPEGTPVYSPGNGVVASVGDSLHGRYVIIMQKPDKWGLADYILTYHYQKTVVKEGEVANAGSTLLGYVGRTGIRVGPIAHLHLELRKWGARLLRLPDARFGTIGESMMVVDSRGRVRSAANPHDKWYKSSHEAPLTISIYEKTKQFTDDVLQGQWIWPLRCGD
jgi:murein DD-endopeptidase MepM/ murein hydrolase activator NlpD